MRWETAEVQVLSLVILLLAVAEAVRIITDAREHQAEEVEADIAGTTRVDRGHRGSGVVMV